MLKTYVVVAVLAVFSTAYGMEKETAKSEYVEDARQLCEHNGLYFNVLPKDVLGIVQYYRLNEMLDRALRAKAYNESLASIQKLVQLPEYAQLFSEPRLMDSLIQKISNRFGKDPEEVARDINTEGTQAWLTHIRPNQIKLFEAAENGDVATVQQLIAQGVSVTAVDRHGLTALMGATICGHIEVVKELIKAGVNVNAQDMFGQTALMWAAAQGRIAIVSMLLAAGVTINAQDRYGRTALMRAACNGHTQIVQLLIAAGAGVAMLDDYGKTALNLARQQNNKDIIELLEKATKK